MAEMQAMTVSDFEKYVNLAFEVRSVSPDIQLSLVEVKSMGSGERAGGAFSVLWQGPKEPVLQQAMYRLYQPEFGEHDLFLVPVAEKDAGVQYEAIFT